MKTMFTCSTRRKRSNFSKLHISAHNLMIETGRHITPRIPPEKRICSNEYHFIIDERKKWAHLRIRSVKYNQGFWIYLYFKIRHSFAHLRPVILSADWSISRLQSWTCSSLPTVAEFVKLTQSIVIEIQRQSADLYKVHFCGVNSDSIVLRRICLYGGCHFIERLGVFMCEIIIRVLPQCLARPRSLCLSKLFGRIISPGKLPDPVRVPDPVQLYQIW